MAGEKVTVKVVQVFLQLFTNVPKLIVTELLIIVILTSNNMSPSTVPLSNYSNVISWLTDWLADDEIRDGPL
jgi:hypothetical protein